MAYMDARQRLFIRNEFAELRSFMRTEYANSREFMRDQSVLTHVSLANELAKALKQ